MGANGILQPREPITHDTVQKYIHEFTFGAGIAQASVGSFSTHCFRRGGAQYYFMFAPVGKRWSLRMVRWWGGWAEGEHVRHRIILMYCWTTKYSISINVAWHPSTISTGWTTFIRRRLLRRSLSYSRTQRCEPFRRTTQHRARHQSSSASHAHVSRRADAEHAHGDNWRNQAECSNISYWCCPEIIWNGS